MSHDPISIIIPVYNEQENIRGVLDAIQREVKDPYRVLLIFDFDEDTTIAPAQSAAEDFQIDLRLIRNRYGKGAANAIRTGLEVADTEFMVVTMADGSDPPSVINRMVERARDGAHLVCASRYCKGGQQIGGPWLKKTLSRLAGVSLWYLTSLPVHDVTNSFKLYSKPVLDAVQIESTGGFEIGMEVLVKAHFQGFRVDEVPTVWRDRSEGESRFQIIKWLPNYLRWYLYALGHQALHLLMGSARVSRTKLPKKIN